MSLGRHGEEYMVFSQPSAQGETVLNNEENVYPHLPRSGINLAVTCNT